jgi:hypothetical protein
MRARALIENLVHHSNARELLEASVHLPRRGTRWIATYRDGSGRQLWRSTGLTNRRAALIVAQEWEKTARRERAAQANLPVLRGRRGSPESGPGLTQREVALVLRISERAVREIERRAIEKLRRSPTLRAIWAEWEGEGIGEGVAPAEDLELTDAEIAAVYGLVQTPDEQRVLDKLMALVSA